MLNDADAAGIAEMRFGSGRGCTGSVIMLTFGTGIGTALFTGGRLFANTELGHLELRGMDAEKWASAHTRTVAGLDFPGWVARVNEYLAALYQLSKCGAVDPKCVAAAIQELGIEIGRAHV